MRYLIRNRIFFFVIFVLKLSLAEESFEEDFGADETTTPFSLSVNSGETTTADIDESNKSDDYLDPNYYPNEEEEDDDDEEGSGGGDDYDGIEEADECTQPRPKTTNSSNPHYWFYFNVETKRCEIFAYDGQISSESNNKFEFFEECYQACNHLIDERIMHVKNPDCINDRYKHCKSKDTEQIMYIFMDFECVGVKACIDPDIQRRRFNDFSTMNECRKTCHFGLDENPMESSTEKVTEKPGNIDKIKNEKCLIPMKQDPIKLPCYPWLRPQNEEDDENVWTFDKDSLRCKKVRACRPLNNYFRTLRQCRGACLKGTPELKGNGERKPELKLFVI